MTVSETGQTPGFHIMLGLPRHFCFTLSSSTALRADRTSLAPPRANARATFSPIPLEAPVIQTTLPANVSEI